MKFTCIYCFKKEPVAVPSKAHIFPYAMGGISESQNRVCEECNIKTNKGFESDEIQKFSFFNSIWGIKNRRGKIKGVPATVEYEGQSFNISLNEKGIPKTPLIFKGNNGKEKKSYRIIGPEPVVKEKQQEIEAKNPSITWKEENLQGDQLPESKFEIASDIGRKSLRRLAAKVAYERWGKLRDAQSLNDEQYSSVRDFISDGIESKVLCGVLNDLKLLNEVLDFSVGHNGAMIIAHPNSCVLGAFVSFYGLFYFWVVLSINSKVTAPFFDLLIENPKTRQIIARPAFRTRIIIDWKSVVDPFLVDPYASSASSIEFAFRKFKRAEDEFISLKKIKHVII